jgi:hypothetical protein
VGGIALARLLLALVSAPSILIVTVRGQVRRRRRYVRLRVEVYRTDQADAEAVATMFDALHKRLMRRWWRRMLLGQRSVALEVHHTGRTSPPSAWFPVTCPQGLERMVQAAYPNCRVRSA